MLGLSPWVSVIVVLLATIVGRLSRVRGTPSINRLLEGRWAPAIFGFLTGIATLWVWGSMRRTPVMHDESAYLLQAQLFARLRWTEAGHSLPQFFEQLYVLVQPVLASKYPPGNSLVLAPGIWVGLPGLPVILLNACAGALFFALARRIAGPLTALLAWLTWMTSFPVLYYHANYMSEAVTSAGWLLTWWALLRWRGRNDSRWLLVAAAAVAWCVITRPLTGVALAVVAVGIVLRLTWQSRAWRQLLPAGALGATIVAILPLWNWRTTGDVGLSPLAAYTRAYVPFDRPGFGARQDEKPSRRLPRDQWITSAAFYQEHARHIPAALPGIARERMSMLARDAWYEWRGALRVFALIGLLCLPTSAWVATAAFALHFLLYLSYAHPSWWTMYYVEGAPLFAFVTALGMLRSVAWLIDRPRSGTDPVRDIGGDRFTRFRHRIAALARELGSEPPAKSRLSVTVWSIALAGLIAGVAVARQVRLKIEQDHAYYDGFSATLTQIPEPRAVVFVRYGPKHLDGLTLVRNTADPARARVWTAYDRGSENALLMSAASDRTPYLFDEANWTLRRLQRPADSTRTRDVAGTPSSVAATTHR